MRTIDREDLCRFLVAANTAGYAGGEARTWAKRDDGSTTISFSLGPWKMDDNFFGGEPYGGREVVFFEGSPAWMLLYYGQVSPAVAPARVYRELREAMRAMPLAHPYRGPDRFEGNGFVYTNHWEGAIDSVAGEETISHNGASVYRARYFGGWIDRRRGE